MLCTLHLKIPQILIPLVTHLYEGTFLGKYISFVLFLLTSLKFIIQQPPFIGDKSETKIVLPFPRSNSQTVRESF